MLTVKRANNFELNNSTEFLIKLKRMCDSLPPAGGASSELLCRNRKWWWASK